jgi:hypothetical protein
MCLTVSEHNNQREIRPKSRSILKSHRSILSGSQPFFLTFTLHKNHGGNPIKEMFSLKKND